jgi:hypothetical protein
MPSSLAVTCLWLPPPPQFILPVVVIVLKLAVAVAIAFYVLISPFITVAFFHWAHTWY